MSHQDRETYVLNPDYGNGCYRRRIRLTRWPGEVLGELEDTAHGFRVRIQHDGSQVTVVTPEFIRFPFTRCASADKPIQNLVGATLDSSVRELNDIAPPKSNCTHVHDLALLAIAHTRAPEETVVYDVEVPDAPNGLSDLRVWRNGMLIHHWQARDNHLVTPEALAGNPLFSGFSRWSEAAFSGIALEAARILQKGNLVSAARMFDFDRMAGNTAFEESDRHVCHTFSPDHARHAVRLGGTARDFTGDPEQLLTFK